MKVYVFAKNEEVNIDKCIRSLKGNAQITSICLLDSGSDDQTKKIAENLGAVVVDYNYVDHCTAYNELTSKFNITNEAVMILDADMVVSSDLINEIIELLKKDFEIILSPVTMYYEGTPLKYSSLYPPKPIAFKTGKEYFEPVGHGERLKEGFKTKKTKNALIHDDKKSFDRFISNQLKYAENFLKRADSEKLTFRDKLRLSLPIGIIITPLYSFLLKLGFLDGKSGFIYALDRLIAESIIYRYALSHRQKKISTDNENKS